MPRNAASIQSEIDIIEARLASADGLANSVGSDGVSISYADRQQLAKRLDQLYLQLDRATGASPMFVRGRVSGLRD